MEKQRARRKVIVVDNRPLAQRIGGRIREARQAAGLSQRQLAAGRFTGAYISALEKGIAKPSMASLAYISERLGVPIRHFLDDAEPAWARLEADVLLASGDWRAALNAYRRLLEAETDRRSRAELLRGVAEALCRLRRGGEAVAPASEAIEIFTSLRRETDAAYAAYWLGVAQQDRNNMPEARSILRDLLERLRGGLDVRDEFKARILTALAEIEAWYGEDQAALGHLEEARALAGELDERSRATFLFTLSRSYRAAGDLEAAVRAANQSLGLYQAAEARHEAAAAENRLAAAHLRMGHVDRAKEFSRDGRALAERLGDQALLSQIADTEAAIALAQGDHDAALQRADEAARLAEAIGNHAALVDAHLTRARVDLARKNPGAASSSFERAAELLREHGPRSRLQQVLREWADVVSSAGDHQRANQLYREALAK